MKKLLFLPAIILAGGLIACGQSSAVDKQTKAVENATQSAGKQDKTSTVKLEREKFDPTRDAAKDLLDTIAQTQKSGKRIVLDVGGEWCVWCRNMDNFFIQNAELAKLRDENFVWLKVNFSEENKNEALLANYPSIKGYPHLYVLDKDGKLIFSKDTSELEQGKSYNLQKFTDFLNEYAPEKSVAK